jgi:hypothetical protein
MVLKTEEMITPHPMAQMVQHPMAQMIPHPMAQMTQHPMVRMETIIMMAQMEATTIMMINQAVIPPTIRTSTFSSQELQPHNKETTCITMLTLIAHRTLTTQK